MNLITRDELRSKLQRGDDFKLVMTLSARSYRAKHIPYSLNFESAVEAVEALDPTEEIVLYCADVHCAASIYAYRLFEREGYTKARKVTRSHHSGCRRSMAETPSREHERG